jgi:hypothetical protein
VLTSQGAQDLDDVYAKVGSSYNATLIVANKEVKTNHASIHWVTPGIFYQPSADSEKIVTSDPQYTENPVKVEQDANYTTGTTWIVGTKAVGTLADGTQVAGISGIGITLVPTAEADLNVSLTPVGGSTSGVCKVNTSGTGSYKITASIDPSTGVNNKITLENGEVYDNVGSGAINGAKALEIGIDWIPDGAQLSIFDTNQQKYDITHQYLSDEECENYIEEYVRVIDKSGNPFPNQNVTYSVKNSNGNYVVEEETEKTAANGMIVVRIPVPKEAGDYTLSAQIDGAGVLSKTIAFVEATDNQFVLTNKSIDTSNGTIELTFNQAVNNTISQDCNFYSVKVGEEELTVDSATVDKNNAAHVVLTIKQTSLLTETAVVSIKATYLDTLGVNHFYIDSVGNLYDGEDIIE